MHRLPRIVGLLLVVGTLAACGGINRQTIVAPPPEAEALIPHLHQAAIARGLPSKSNESSTVKFFSDRERGTRMYFNIKRKGLVMLIRVDDEKVKDPAAQNTAFADAEALGKALLADARSRLAAKREAARRAEEERRRREAAAAAAAPPPPPPRPIPGVRMPKMPTMPTVGSPSQRAAARRAARNKTRTPAASTSTSHHCCVNKQFFACPSPAAVDKCVGKFMRCLTACGISKMECAMKCSKTNPPDPSSCKRTPVNDGKCR